jgi:hypothetical protein
MVAVAIQDDFEQMAACFYKGVCFKTHLYEGISAS